MNLSVKTAAAYIRVSTERQEELSPDAQKRELKKYAKKNGILITDFYYDNGISGKKAEKRPQFQQMISFAKSPEHPYDYILVWKYSRFARNQEESIVYKSLLRKNNVEVISITEPLIDGPFASLIERIIEWMDEYYSIRLAGDVKRGMMEKALRGGYQSALPLGYQMNAEHIPEIYEPEAIIVREAFRLCKENYTITTIARMLNDAGYRSRHQNRFERRTVLYILQNPFYIGMVRWNHTKHGSYQQNAEKDTIMVKGIHEALISKKEFDNVQNIIARYDRRHNHMCRRKSDTLFKHYLCGIMKCPICGKNLAYHCANKKQITDKSYPYFVCWQYSKGYHRIGGNISARRCEEALKESIQSITGRESSALHFEKNKKAADPSLLLDKYYAALTRLNQKEHRIKETYIDGIDTKEEYRENKLILSEERTKLEQLIATVQKTATTNFHPQNAEHLVLRQHDILRLIQEPDVDPLKKHQALKTILEKTEYRRDIDTFRFYYLYS